LLAKPRLLGFSRPNSVQLRARGRHYFRSLLGDALSPYSRYVRTVRRSAPRPGPALEKLRRVEKAATALDLAIADALQDHWLDAASDIEFFRFVPVLGALQRNRQFVSAIRGAAEKGIAAYGTRQRQGQPSNARARVLALLLLSITKRYAPPPSPGSGVKRWRQVVASFVLAVTAATDLPTVNRQFLERALSA